MNKKELLILTAPPASGKTYFISELMNQLDDIPLMISPLRALANECLSNWGDKCSVMTPEEWMKKRAKARVLILDEFHLYFYWGDSFRPLMWEAFYEMVEGAELVILLTATLTEEMVETIRTFDCHFDGMHWIDHGNQCLKFKPMRYLKAPNERWLEDYLMTCTGKTSEVTLIFCAYRAEVLKWERKIINQGHRVWSCVGGEASLFSQKVASEKPPEFIVATTVLSHGVNLPQVSKIVFLYQVKNLDFWIQMVARGGRRGEKFEVLALENPIGIKWSKILNFLAITRLSLKMKGQLLLKQTEEWFLKAS